MEYCNSQKTSHSVAVKLIFTLVLSLFFCEEAVSQEREVEKRRIDSMTLSQQRQELENELLQIIRQGVETNLISEGLRDTILQYIRNTNFFSTNKSFKLGGLTKGNIVDSLPPHQIIVIRDGIPMVVDTTVSGAYIPKERLEFAIEKSPEQVLDHSASRNVKNGINNSMLFPDKLPVPQRSSENRNRYQYMTQEELKRSILRVDYFSKGLDGYYEKLIAMGYIGEGWEETREIREAMDRLRTSMKENLSDMGYYSGEPEFIGKLSKSRNPLVKFLGGLLRMLNNGAQGQVRHGYTNPNPMIKTPPTPPRR